MPAQYVVDAAEAVSFHEIFERRVRDAPQKRALLIDDRAATYLELEQSANRVAGWLYSRGISAGTHVAISLPISIEAVATVLGILKAGCVIVTNHPAFSEDKLVQQIRSSDSRVLVSESGAVFPGVFARTNLQSGLLIGPESFVADERITRFRDLNADLEGFAPAFEPSRTRRAAIFHTTGSTFEPKGVVITHGNMIAAFQSITAYLHSTSDDVILHYASFSFDFGIYNTIMPLMFGGSAIAERAIPERAEDILATIKRERVTALHFMPPVVFQVCKAENVDASMMSTVRYLSSTGQILPEKYIHQLRHTFPNVDLLSMYGMNEATRVLYLPPEQIERRPTSVGKAIPGVRTYLVDDGGELIARANQVGELAVAGDLVMQGYWQLPEHNARVFRHDVFGEDRIFLTGDMFRMDEEGYLYYICRKDDVFTRSMFQVNPKEIERHLLAYDGVAEAVVVPVAAPGVGHVPKANVVLTAGASDVTPAKLIAYCSSRLDWHMVPAEIEILESLPRSLSGKTKIRDVSAAPTLREEGGRVDGEYLRNTAMLRLAEQFDDLAAGRRQVPRQPVRTELLHKVADHRRMAYHDLLTSKMGPLFAHFLASVPYILEELCRVGVAIEALSRWRSERGNHASAFYEADAFDGSNGRALGRYSDFKIATLTNSPNPANKAYFDRFVEAGQAAFFQGTFLELDRSVLSSRAEYSKFGAGFDYIYETAALQFYGTDRDRHVEHLANLLRPEGLAIFMHKLSHPDEAEFRERERRKDETFKTKYFTTEEIAWKRERMLDQMHTGLIPLQETIAVMKGHFRHVGLIWNSGNFHEILASNDGAMFDRFLSIIGEPIIPAEFCTERLGVC